MRTLGRSLFLAGIVTIAAAAVSGIALAEEERLLVVVESGPGTGVDAREVRQTIGAELGIPVVAPTDALAADASNVLIVSVDKNDIRMSLRGSGTGLVVRTIPTPLDRPGRMREIGWLAGNLARDQVSGIVAVPAARSSARRELLLAAADVPPASETPPAVAPPPASLSVAAPTLEPAVTISVRPVDAAASQGSRWSITAGGGPTGTYYSSAHLDSPIRGATYQVEVQRQASPDGHFFGAALEVGTDHDGSQNFGLAGLMGSRWRARRWFLEASAGVGLELAPLEERTVTDSSLTGSSSSTSVASQPVLYVRGMGTLGFPISSSLDLVASLGLHIASSGGFSTDFLSATAGLRFTLP